MEMNFGSLFVFSDNSISQRVLWLLAMQKNKTKQKQTNQKKQNKNKNKKQNKNKQKASKIKKKPTENKVVIIY